MDSIPNRLHLHGESTDMATSLLQAVTIDDIVCVINSGRHKEKSYDPYTNVSTLQAQWISQASERQRRGRAGRCQQVPSRILESKMTAQAHHRLSMATCSQGVPESTVTGE